MKNALMIALLGTIVATGTNAQTNGFFTGVYSSVDLPRVQGLIDGLIARGGDRMRDVFSEIRKGDWGDAIEELLERMNWPDQALLLRYLPHAINHAEARLGLRGHSIPYPMTDANGHMSPAEMAVVRQIIDTACQSRHTVEEVREALSESDWVDVAEDLMRGIKASADQQMVLRYFPYGLRYMAQRLGNPYPIADPSFESIQVPVSVGR